jgi:conjugative relaxase-like TrwC/TraI family protein
MMTVHRLGAGDGYRYLTDQVAKGDAPKVGGDRASDYYLQSGNPPGRWMGSGVEALGVSGQVQTKQMHNLYGLGLHPETGVQLGRRYAIYRSIAERVADRVEAAEAKLGHELPQAARATIEREEKAKGEKQAVAGFDLVFSPVKSISLAWALGEDWVSAEIEAAHHAAVQHVIATIEQDVAFARVGAAGVAQVDVDGVTVAAFDHRTSRAGDPDLHTHAVVSNKVRARLPDGTTKWLTLDSMSLHKATVSMSERYNRVVEDEVTRRLGWSFEVREDQDADESTAIREIAGVPYAVIKGFSDRRAKIEARYAELLSSYAREHGHTPPKAMQYELAQQATLETRKAKDHAETVGEERARWRAQAAAMLDENGRRRPRRGC